jgi:hypothetical protein
VFIVWFFINFDNVLPFYDYVYSLYECYQFVNINTAIEHKWVFLSKTRPGWAIGWVGFLGLYKAVKKEF